MAMRCAVLGHPIAHSLSPALHRAAYAELGLDWSYDAIDVDPAGLEGFLGGLDGGWRGLSLTMPLKRVVVPLLDSADEWTRLSGVANTVVLGETGRAGHNTDIPGAVAAIRERTDRPLERAVVLGGGATAASVLLALAELGCAHASIRVRDAGRAAETVSVVARRPRAPQLSVGRLDEEADGFEDADIVVSTIPAAAQTPALVERWAGVPVAFEVVYDPWPTPIAAAALASGRTLVSGLDLLVHQAARQVALMTGAPHAPLLPALRRAGEEALARRL